MTLSATIAALTPAQRRAVYYAAPNGLQAQRIKDSAGLGRTEFRTTLPHAAGIAFDYGTIGELTLGNAYRPALFVLRKDGRGAPTWADLTEHGLAVAKVLARERWEEAKTP